MNQPREVAVDLALGEVKEAKALVRQARTLYRQVELEIKTLEARDDESVTEAVTRLSRIKLLKQESVRLFEAAHRPFEFVGAALSRLRQINGVSTESVVTPQIAQLVALRLSQGYSLNEVAMMVGCTNGTVSNLKAGRYLVSDLPADSKIGSRGRKKKSLKVF